MTVRNIPYPIIAEHLQLELPSEKTQVRLLSTLQEIIDQKLFNPGILNLPILSLDRIVYFLDEKTAFTLKITSITFRCLVRENFYHEARVMRLFFDQASYQLALRPEEYFGEHKAALSEEQAKRGDFEKALQNVPSHDNYRCGTLRTIAAHQALQGDMNAATQSLDLINNSHTQAEYYKYISLQLAERGDYANALLFASRITWEVIALSSYKEILSAQVVRGDDEIAFETAAMLITGPLGSFHDQLYEAIANKQGLKGKMDLALKTLEKIESQTDREEAYALILRNQRDQLQDAKNLASPDTIKDPTEKMLVHLKLALKDVQMGQLDSALERTQSMSPFFRDSVYGHLAKAHIRLGKLEAAIALADYPQKPESKDRILTLIGQEQAKQGNFRGCFQTIDRISSTVYQAKAYQQVVTVLSSEGL